MSSHKELDVSLDLEDFTPRQLRKLLSKIARKQSVREMDEEDIEKAISDNDDLVNLREEKKGDSKPPKVKKDDLPISDNDLDPTPEEEDEDEEMIAKDSDKKRRSGKDKRDG